MSETQEMQSADVGDDTPTRPMGDRAMNRISHSPPVNGEDVGPATVKQPLSRPEALPAEPAKPVAAGVGGDAPAAPNEALDKARKLAEAVPTGPVDGLPERLRKRYFIEQNGDEAHLYLDRDAAARKVPTIVDGGDTLGTKVHNKDVVRDIVDIAEHRGWQQISVTGTPEFRRDAWLEAASRGIEVKGYKPSEIDLQELARRVEARPDLGIRNAGPGPGAPEAPAAPGAPAAPKAAGPDAPAAPRLQLPEGAGTLVAHGQAPYQFDKTKDPSYFARLAGADGKEHVVWGKNIKAAIEAAGALKGDVIALKRGGKEGVTVDTAERDAEGKVIRPVTKETHRNEWTAEIISKGPGHAAPSAPGQNGKELADRFLATSPADAAKHPDLHEAFSRLAVVQAALSNAGVKVDEQQRIVGDTKQMIARDLVNGGYPEKLMLRDDPARPDLGEKLAAGQADLAAFRPENAIKRDIRVAESRAAGDVERVAGPGGKDIRDPAAPKAGPDKAEARKQDKPAPKVRR